MTHTGDPVPFALYRHIHGRGEQTGSNPGVRYTENAAAATGLFEPAGYRLLDRLMKN